MSEILLTCPCCAQPGFTERGLRAHHCRRLGRQRLAPGHILHAERLARAEQAAAEHSPRMSKPNTSSALAVISSAELRADDAQLALLQASAAEQFKRLRALRGEESLRGLLLGLQLMRIKHSMPYGSFGKWAKAHATLGDRWVNYLMKLALVFIDKAKATKPELLACPGDQTELQLDTLEGEQRRFVAKAMKFVGEHSLSELLEKHGIKETKGLGGKRTAGEKPAEPATPEQLAQQTRDEVGTAIQTLEQLLVAENRLQYVVADAEFLQGTIESLELLATKTAALVTQLLKPAKATKSAA